MFKGLRFFLREGWKYDKLYIVWQILYQFVNSMIPVVATLMPKYIIDELLGQRRVGQLALYIGILTGYTCFASALSSFLSMDGFTRRCRVSAEFDSDLHRRLVRADYEKLENPDFLDMQEKAKKFLYCEYHGFGYLLDCALNIVGQLFTLAGIAYIVATLDLRLIAFFAALSAAGMWFEGRAKKKARALSMEMVTGQRRWAQYARLSEDWHYGKEIRLNVLGDWLLKKERSLFTLINRNQKKQNDAYIRSGLISSLLTLAQQCTAYAYLIRQALKGLVTVGSFTMYVGAVTTFASALRNMLNSLIEIRAYDMYYDDLDQYLSVPASLREGGEKNIPAGAHTIEFKNVGFRYAGSEKWALRNISLTLRPGEKLSVVGENGSGKTTFVKLLTRLYDPTEGAILLDGRDIRQIDYDAYMSLFSAVFQDFRLFSLPLKENVALTSDAGDEEIDAVLRRVGLGARLDSLPKGIHTYVYKDFDETGFEPSGGEGQKIALARALYKNAPLVVLDEPTAALDPRAEFEIYRHFNELIDKKTAVYISHRLSSAKFCDRIAVFDSGSLIELGTHEQLMRAKGKYAELFDMQAQFYL